VPDPTLAEQVSAAWADAVDDVKAMRAARLRLVAIGWATVELDRAMSELAGALGLPRGLEAFLAAPRSAVLGGACRVATGVLPDGGSLVVLEPDTEGRLAGSLARLGEGPVAAWIAAEPVAAAMAGLEAARVATSGEGPGPFGGERLLLGGPVYGPHRLIVERVRATPRTL
jgi:hypothetical protein